MFFRKSLSVFLTLLIAFGVTTELYVSAQNKESNLIERKNQKKQTAEGSDCTCLKPATEAIQKAYASLEEDEWPKAITECKNAIIAINNLSKTCTCSEVNAYKIAANSFLKYAEGGNHLDGADEPDCPYALKTYDSSISGLKDVLEKITDKDVKTSVKNTLEYAREEELFIKDECVDQKKS